MNVTLVDSMGTDLSVANAARVSFAKKNTEFKEPGDRKLINFLSPGSLNSSFFFANDTLAALATDKSVPILSISVTFMDL